MSMLHHVLPHVHHEHEGIEYSVDNAKDKHHSHGKDHHHHDDEGDNDFDFFDFLLGNHVHNIQTDDFTRVKDVFSQQVTSKHISYDALTDSQIFSPLDWNVQKSKLEHAPPDFTIRIYLSTYSLRGPPTLG